MNHSIYSLVLAKRYYSVANEIHLSDSIGLSDLL